MTDENRKFYPTRKEAEKIRIDGESIFYAKNLGYYIIKKREPKEISPPKPPKSEYELNKDSIKIFDIFIKSQIILNSICLVIFTILKILLLKYTLDFDWIILIPFIFAYNVACIVYTLKSRQTFIDFGSFLTLNEVAKYHKKKIDKLRDDSHE